MSGIERQPDAFNRPQEGYPRDEDGRSLCPHGRSVEEILSAYRSSKHGLSGAEVAARLQRYGPNTLPEAKPLGAGTVFLRQFASPLIYVLLLAALLSMAIQEWSDAGFIAAVLLINGIIGALQEFSAQRAAAALRNLVTTRCRVLREGEDFEVDAQNLVPGDIVLLESGDRIPADARLFSSHDLEVDESLLTGESLAVRKDADAVLDADTVLGDRRNMLFAGSLVARGRAQSVVVATALSTELGRISEAVLEKAPTKPPLLIRMEKFTRRVAILIGGAAIVMAGVALSRGMAPSEIFLLAVALSVSAIPEGLPVALTVALAIGMRRMARRNVIVRKLIAVEALGSCTFIATDKTGTLTVNQLTARRLGFPRLGSWEVTGSAAEPEGTIITSKGAPSPEEEALLERLCQSVVLANEGSLSRRDGGWSCHGDAVDVALLIMARKAGFTKGELLNAHPELATIPFESERLFSASMNGGEDAAQAFVKGALERLLPMCSHMAGLRGDLPLDGELLEREAREMARCGYRVIAVASGGIELQSGEVFSEEHLRGLTLLGLVGMIDPLRTEAKGAIAQCRKAGIEVAMITGDHPITAAAIARELDLIEGEEGIITGAELKRAAERGEMDEATRGIRVFARVEPHQKLEIVESLQRGGHFVAVSGDGANDAPALQAAHVGVAMGKSGTDVARETAELILTDDNFASIVGGVEEGRIAYANVRKVIFLLISTGMGELVLFALALMAGLPIPLMAVQLLWLNLVTNGIQDVALAFEPGEGDELNRPPRPPKDPIFNRTMVERVILTGLVFGGVSFFLFQSLLSLGHSVEAARNETLLLMVLFENLHVLNCRSEKRSIFRSRWLSNPILIFGTIGSQLIHIGAMYVPWVSQILEIEPVSLKDWLQLLGMAATILVVMELYKAGYAVAGRRKAKG